MAGTPVPERALTDREQGRVQAVEAAFGYTFTNKRLVLAALATQGPGGSFQHERLEFLGDACIGFLISEHLFKLLSGRSGPDREGLRHNEPCSQPRSEGDMSKLKGALQSNAYLGRCLGRRLLQRASLAVPDVLDAPEEARQGLERWLREELRVRPQTLSQWCTGANEAVEFADFLHTLLQPNKQFEPPIPKLMADTYEAVVGAICVDSHFDTELIFRVLRCDLDIDLSAALSSSDLQSSPAAFTNFKLTSEDRKLLDHLKIHVNP